MKTCARCKEEKNEDCFGVSKAKGLQAYCRPCNKEYAQERYREQRTWYVQRNKAAKKRNLAFIVALKNAPCTDCGQKYPPEAMDFDHVRGRKKKDLAKMVVDMASIEAIKEEIAKCELVCAVCHRIRTANRRK